MANEFCQQHKIGGKCPIKGNQRMHPPSLMSWCTAEKLFHCKNYEAHWSTVDVYWLYVGLVWSCIVCTPPPPGLLQLFQNYDDASAPVFAEPKRNPNTPSLPLLPLAISASFNNQQPGLTSPPFVQQMAGVSENFHIDAILPLKASGRKGLVPKSKSW